MAASSSPPPDLSSSAAYEDDTPAPPGWKRKLVPRIGKGLTPTKTDVIYIAPEGEEIKSKTQLQRYLKAHKDGPVISEFNWSSVETPRRSARLTSKISTSPMDVEIGPQTSKRKSAEMPHEEINVDKPFSSPKRTKKVGKNVAVESNDVGGISSIGSITEGKEAIAEVKKEEGSFLSSETAEPVSANGGLQKSKEDEDVNNAKDIQEDENYEIASKEELTYQDNGEDSIPANPKKTQGISEPVNGEITMEKEETMLTMDTCRESLEPLNIKSTVDVEDPEPQRKAVHSALAEPSLTSEEKEQVLGDANCHTEHSPLMETSQNYESSMQNDIHSPDPAGLSN